MIPDNTVTLPASPDAGAPEVAFDVLGWVDSGSGYDWQVEALLRRQSDRALFLVADGGCSCNHFGLGLTIADLTPVRSVVHALSACSDRASLKRSIAAREEVYVGEV